MSDRALREAFDAYSSMDEAERMGRELRPLPDEWLRRYPRLTAEDVTPCPHCGHPSFASLTAHERGRRHVSGATIACDPR